MNKTGGKVGVLGLAGEVVGLVGFWINILNLQNF